MKDRMILRTGVVGAVTAGLCCFTPILVITFGALGLSALVGWRDVVLLPMLAASLGMVGYGLWRRRASS